MKVNMKYIYSQKYYHILVSWVRRVKRDDGLYLILT